MGQHYGQPPAGAYGQPQGMAPYQGQPMAAPQGGLGTLQSAGGPGPTRRNALMTFLVPGLVMFGGIIVGTILTFLLGFVGSLIAMLAVIAGAVLFFLSAIKMINEVKAVTRNPAFPWWPLIVPFYNIYFLWFMVPAEVTKAKQMMGVQTPPRSIVLYIFLWSFALASDINDMVR